MQLDHYWVIMDKKRGLIATGSPRDRHLSVIGTFKKRIMVYSTKQKAISAFTDSFFYTYDLADKYIRENYPELLVVNGYIRIESIRSILEAVEVEVTVVEK